MKKYLFFWLAMGLAFCVSAQAVVGGGGVCKTTGDPDLITNLRTMSQYYECSLAWDTVGNKLYVYRQADPVGDRWDEVSAQAITALPVIGNGTAGSPITLGQQGATTGQALTWNGTSWVPSTVSVTDGDKGDVVVSGSGTTWLLDASGVTAGTYGSGSAIPVITVDAKGRITNLTTVSGSFPPTGTASGDLAGTYPSPTVDGLQGQPVSATVPTSNQVLKWNGSAWAPATDATGTGTVTSVGLSMPAQFTVTGSPVTSSGTLSAAWASQSANQVFASPNGSAGVPGFRALVGADFSGLGIANRGAFFNASNALSADNYFLYSSARQQMSLGGTVTTGNHKFEIRNIITGVQIRMNHDQIYFTTPGFANMVIRNVYSGAKGLYINDASCCDTLNSPQTPFFAFNHNFGGTDVNRSYYPLVTPSITITTGAAAGRVLQSNASGTGSWVKQWSTSGNYLQATANSIQVFGGATSIPTSVFYNNNSFTSAGSNSNDNIVLQNQNNTDGNMGSLIFNNSTGSITAGIYGVTTSHAAANGELYINTREGGNWQTRHVIRNNSYFQRLSISPNSIFSGDAAMSIRGPGGSSGTYSLIVTNSGGLTTTASLAVRDDGFIGIGTNAPARRFHINGEMRLTTATGTNHNSVMIINSSGDIGWTTGTASGQVLQFNGTTWAPATLSLTDTHFANTDLSLTANRTHTFAGFSMTLNAAGSSPGNSTPLRIQGRTDGSNTTQFLTAQNASATALFAGTISSTVSTLEALNGNMLRVGAGSRYTGFSTEGSMELYNHSTDPTTIADGEFWYNSAVERLKYMASATQTVATVEVDLQGQGILTTSSSYTIVPNIMTIQADANSNNISLVAGDGLREGYDYMIKAVRNATNTVTVNAQSGYILRVDGSSGLSDTSFLIPAHAVVTLRKIPGTSTIIVDQ